MALKHKVKYSNDKMECIIECNVYEFIEAPIGMCCDTCDVRKLCDEVGKGGATLLLACYPNARKDCKNGKWRYLTVAPVDVKKVKDTRNAFEKNVCDLILGG